MHWRAWDDLCKPKNQGDMGFRHLFAFNLAMLAKQAWRILQNSLSLISRLYKAIYFPYRSFWKVEVRSHISYSWRSILAARDVLQGGIKCQIGDGTTTRLWEDPWLPGIDLTPQPTLLQGVGCLVIIF